MSIIKSDDKNTNWQFNVLKGLQSLSNLLTTLSNKISPVVPIEITPVIIFENNTQSTPSVLNEAVKSITFASIGTGPAAISFDGGLIFQELKNGTVINMDAGGVNNFYAAGKFSWDTTLADYPGAELLITYNK